MKLLYILALIILDGSSLVHSLTSMVVVFLGPDSFCSFSFISLYILFNIRRALGALDFYVYQKKRECDMIWILAMPAWQFFFSLGGVFLFVYFRGLHTRSAHIFWRIFWKWLDIDWLHIIKLMIMVKKRCGKCRNKLKL